VYEYLVIQSMFYCIPYPNKCVCSRQNCEATSILSGDITVSRFWRPSWTPSWILERAPVGFTGILCMLFLVVLRMFPEKFSFGICFAPSESNALRLSLKLIFKSCKPNDCHVKPYKHCLILSNLLP